MARDVAACSLALIAMLIPPALAVGASSRAELTLSGGGLSADAPARVELPTVRLAGEPQTVEATVGPIRVTDTRAPSGGWTLTASADRPRDARGREMAAALTLRPSAPDGASRPDLVVGAEGPADTPTALLSAPPGAPGGIVEVSPGIRLTVPGDAASGVYTATLVITVS